MFAHGGVERGLGIVEGAQARFDLVTGVQQGVHGPIEFALAGRGGLVTDPQALAEEGFQSGVDRLARLDFPGGREFGMGRHDGMGALEPLPAVFEVGLEAIRVVVEVLQGAPPPTAALMDERPGATRHGERHDGGKCIIHKGKHARSSPWERPPAVDPAKGRVCPKGGGGRKIPANHLTG